MKARIHAALNAVSGITATVTTSLADQYEIVFTAPIPNSDQLQDVEPVASPVPSGDAAIVNHT